MLQLDTGDFKSLDDFVEKVLSALRSTWNVSSLDFLVNNAGMGTNIPFLQGAEEILLSFSTLILKASIF